MATISFSNANFEKNVYNDLKYATDTLRTAQSIATRLDPVDFPARGIIAELPDFLALKIDCVSSYTSWLSETNRKLDAISTSIQEEISNISVIDVTRH